MSVKINMFMFLCLTGFYVSGSLIERMVWNSKIVAEINTANVKIGDTACPANAWLEVAPGEAANSVRYRYGGPLWPFYRSGESQAAARFLERSTSTL